MPDLSLDLKVRTVVNNRRVQVLFRDMRTGLIRRDPRERSFGCDNLNSGYPLLQRPFVRAAEVPIALKRMLELEGVLPLRNDDDRRQITIQCDDPLWSIRLPRSSSTRPNHEW